MPFCAGLGHIPVWKSEVYPDHYQWWTKKTGRPLDVYGHYLLDGGDMVRTVVERCRRHGMAPFISLRMNDVHMQENVGKNTPNSVWVSRFYEEHPDLLLEPDHAQRHPKGTIAGAGRMGQGSGPPTQARFPHRVVRELRSRGRRTRLAPRRSYLPQGFPADEAKADHGRVPSRGPATARSHGTRRPRRYLGVRVPLRGCARRLRLRRCPGRGFGRRHSQLLRLVQQPANHRSCRDPPHGAGRCMLHELTHTAGMIQADPNPSGYTPTQSPAPRTRCIYTAANLAYARGADGISLFNFVYYRMGTASCRGWCGNRPSTCCPNSAIAIGSRGSPNSTG